MAEARVEAKARSRGRPASEHELGVVIGDIRRSQSLAFVRAQALCLRARLSQLGEGAREAAGRRQQALLEEERRSRDRVAHYQAHLRGRGVPWAGEIFHRH